MQEEDQRQPQSQYGEDPRDSQQQSEGLEQEEQQALQDAPQSSAGRIGFIGAGQVQHCSQAAVVMQRHRKASYEQHCVHTLAWPKHIFPSRSCPKGGVYFAILHAQQDGKTACHHPMTCTMCMQMGEALICGFVNAGMCTPDRISVSVRSEERSQRMLSLGVQVGNLPVTIFLQICITCWQCCLPD